MPTYKRVEYNINGINCKLKNAMLYLHFFICQMRSPGADWPVRNSLGKLIKGAPLVGVALLVSNSYIENCVRPVHYFSPYIAVLNICTKSTFGVSPIVETASLQINKNG